MPRIKTKAAAKKRFVFTGTGKIKRHHAYHSHILTKKSTKRKRNLGYETIVDKTNVKAVKMMLNCQLNKVINFTISKKVRLLDADVKKKERKILCQDQ